MGEIRTRTSDPIRQSKCLRPRGNHQEPCLVPKDSVPGYVYRAGEADLHTHKSFVQFPLEIDIRQNIHFVEKKNWESLSGAYQRVNGDSVCSVSILDYNGNLLRNMQVTPRGYSKHSRTSEHQLKSENMKHKMNEIDCIIITEFWIKRSVGFRVYRKTEIFTIPPERILGVRDLAMASALSQYLFRKRKHIECPKYTSISSPVTQKERGLWTEATTHKVQEFYLVVESRRKYDIVIRQFPQTKSSHRNSWRYGNRQRQASYCKFSPYSPFLNPVASVFSKLKHQIFKTYFPDNGIKISGA